MLGDTLDQKIQAYLRAIRENGGSVGTTIITADALGIVIKEDRRLLAEYGGSVMLKKTWAQSLLQQMGFVKHRATTKSNVAVAQARKEIFLSDIAAIVVMEEIPKDLIINWDHTGSNLIPSSSWTMEKKGSWQVELAGLNDKRQITALVWKLDWSVPASTSHLQGKGRQMPSYLQLSL